MNKSIISGNITGTIKQSIIARIVMLMVAAAFLQPAFAKEKQDYINDLSSNDLGIVKEASKWLGEEKPKDAIGPMLNAVRNQRSNAAKIAIITALGNYKDNEGEPTTGLRSVIETDADNNVVYSALLAIMNVKDFKNPDTLKAIDYCETNKQDDPFLRDITGRMRKIITK